MTYPIPSDLTRAKAHNAIRYPGTPNPATDMIHATGAAVERERIAAFFDKLGMGQHAARIRAGAHWEASSG